MDQVQDVEEGCLKSYHILYKIFVSQQPLLQWKEKQKADVVLWQQVGVHDYEMAYASAHYKKMKNLMAAEIFMLVIKNREL